MYTITSRFRLSHPYNIFWYRYCKRQVGMSDWNTGTNQPFFLNWWCLNLLIKCGRWLFGCGIRYKGTKCRTILHNPGDVVTLIGPRSYFVRWGHYFFLSMLCSFGDLLMCPQSSLALSFLWVNYWGVFKRHSTNIMNDSLFHSQSYICSQRWHHRFKSDVAKCVFSGAWSFFWSPDQVR